MLMAVLDVSPVDLRYLHDLERKIKKILAAYEAMVARQKPGLAQFRWPEGQRVPDYYGNDLWSYMLEVWDRSDRPLSSPTAVRQVERLLCEVEAWTPAQRRLWWARLGGARWKDLYVITGRRYTRQQLQAVYDELLRRVARALTS